jgi:putative DNA primase/helicase
MDIKKKVEQRIKEAEQKMGVSEIEVDSSFVMDCLKKNELGDGELFKKLFRDKFGYNKAMDIWMYWGGHHWNLDKMDFARAAVERVAGCYLGEAKKLSLEINKGLAEDKPVADLIAKRKALIKRADALRSRRRRENCLFFAHTTENPLAIDGSEVDQKPWLFPCNNGVIRLKTGELEPGRPRDYLLKASPIDFPPDGINADHTEWENPLLEIFSGNQNLVDFFRRICGYSLVGEVYQSILVVMTGQGRNGKSMIVEAISKTLGPMAGAIRPEMLLDQNRVASSSGPSPDIMTLRGMRMAFASETDDGCRISPSRVKWLTGNDTITGRNPHDKYEVQFKPSHTLFLLTNHKPRAPADDFAFWERMILFPFELSFVDREPKNENERRADPQLAKRLEKNLPSILAWMVKGCLEWQRDGLKPPAIVKDAVKEYQRDEDIISDFIEECCVVGPECFVGATAIYEVFEEWWKTNVSNKVPKQKRFGTLLGRRFEKIRGSTFKYVGVGLLNKPDKAG